MPERKDAFFSLMGAYCKSRKVSAPWRETRMAKAWKNCARDLKIEFVSPYVLRSLDGKEYICSGILPQFGSEKGMLIISGTQDPDIEKLWDVAEELEMRFSGLSPLYYEKYNRFSFIRTLIDWGWYGPPQKKPFWFLDREPCSFDTKCEYCLHTNGKADPAICSSKKLCKACAFANKNPYWLNEDWKSRQQRLKKSKYEWKESKK